MLSDEKMIETLNGLCSYKSVAERTGNPDCPYGVETNAALKYMLDVCREFGFRTENLDNQLGYAEIGEGEELFGILVHLDVVPAGDGWDYEPYGATLAENRIYGRGVIDDKGPAVACIYAMKDLLDLNKKFRRRIRIIFGQTEEAGEWDDMQYYKDHEELPLLGFTPDAHFPAIYAEKGIYQFKVICPMAKSGFKRIEGGVAANMVPNSANAEIVLPDGSTESFTAAGVAAHGSTPEAGENAVSNLMQEIAEFCREKGIETPYLTDFYNKYIGYDTTGKGLGIDSGDDVYGKLTLNVGRVYTDNENVNMLFDIRYPVNIEYTDIEAKLEQLIRNLGMDISLNSQSNPVYMDKNGALMTQLVNVYHEMTGLEGEAELIGGGTYARAMDNIIAFGPTIPGMEQTEHKTNEYISKDAFLLLRKIYRETLERTCME